MLVRIATAVIAIPLGILVIFAYGGMLFVPVIAILSLIGVHEFYNGARKLGAQPAEWAGWIGCLLLISSRVWQPVENALGTYLLLLFMAALLAEIARPSRAPIKNLGATLLGVAYVGWLFTFMVRLRALDIGPIFGAPLLIRSGQWDTSSFGAWLVLFLLFLIWACDSGAYFTGRYFGKHKLCPNLSPGKTWEGAVGGVVIAAVVALLTGGWLAFPLVNRMAIGALIAVTAILGDLVESAMKREIGIKDFGSIMPGHGGVLDRFDSLLFSAPVLLYIVKLYYLACNFGN